MSDQKTTSASADQSRSDDPDAPRRSTPSLQATLTEDAQGRLRTSDAAGDEAAPRVGGYFLLERLGVGATGVVYAAFDPELERKIAIKLLKREVDADPKKRERLLAEARSLAKLSHPNVVTVHGTGQSERGTYIAMELVIGQDVAQWLAAEPRSLDEILDVFIAAGEGLAAAHRAGVIHRDFKPHNVLIGSDGTVRVADFGLARVAEMPEDAEEGPLPSGPISVKETHGRIVGTPIYMPPEQHESEPITPAADQFAWCTSLYEAICGEPPFRGRRLWELLESKLEGTWPKQPASAALPRWLVPILKRGLAPNADDRFPDMATLVAAVSRGRHQRARRLRTGAVAGLGALAVAAIALQLRPRDAPADAAAPPADPCAGLDAKLDGVWDDDARTRAETAFMATKRAYASAAFTAASTHLDGYANAWVVARESVCRAHEDHELSDELFDARVECLEARRGELSEISRLLVEADAAVVTRVDELLPTVRPVSTCDASAAELDRRRRLPAGLEPEAAREEIAKVQRLQAEIAGGRPQEVKAQIEAWQATDFAEIRHPLARSIMFGLAANFSEPDRRVEFARAAVREALRSHDEVQLLLAQANLVGHLTPLPDRGQLDTEAELGFAFADRAAALAEDDDNLALQLDMTRGALHHQLGMRDADEGALASAQAHYEKTLAAWEPHAEIYPRRYLNLRNNLGEACRMSGRYDEAIEHYAAAEKLAAEVFSRTHPSYATVISNRGAALMAMGKIPEAYADLLAAAEIDAALDGDPTGIRSYNLGVVAAVMGRPDEAWERLSNARDKWTEQLGPDSEYVGLAMEGMSAVLRMQLRNAEAIRLGSEALAKIRAASDRPRMALASTIGELGLSRLESGDLTGARRDLEAAVEMMAKMEHHDPITSAAANLGMARVERELGFGDPVARIDAILTATEDMPWHYVRAAAMLERGELELDRGHATEAIDWLERAQKIFDDGPVDPTVGLRIRVQLANALAADPDQAARRSDLRRRCREDAAEIGPRADPVIELLKSD